MTQYEYKSAIQTRIPVHSKDGIHQFIVKTGLVQLLSFSYILHYTILTISDISLQEKCDLK